MNKTHARRLLKLADLLDTIPAERFYLGTWCGPDWAGAPDLSCGTTACALGWATTIPEFRKLGVRMKREGINVGPGFAQARCPNPAGVAKRLFGICDTTDRGYEDYNYLFFPSAYPRDSRTKPREVAARIREFVSERCP